MPLLIFYSYQNNKEMKAVNPKITQKEIDQVDTWVGEMQEKTLTKVLDAKTKYSFESGTGETLKKIDEKDGLRIDLQKVIGVGKKVEEVSYVFVNKKKPATRDDYLAFLEKPKSAKVMEISGKTTYEALWSLFAVQKVSTYNRVFHLNNLHDALTIAQWKTVFQKTLEGCCTAIITTNKTLIPSGYSTDQLLDEDSL